MFRFLYALLLGVVGAAIVHAAVLIMLPTMSTQNVWSKLAETGDLYGTQAFAGPLSPQTIAGDPFFRAAGCRFEIGENLVHVRSEGQLPFWSVSVYDSAGQNVYSLNDRTASGGSLDLVILSSAQMIELRKELPPQFDKSIFIETNIADGFVVLRAFAGDDSWTDKVERYLAGMTCEPG